MHINEFDYHLPEELIARYPLKNRSDSRLMIVNPDEQSLKHETFNHLLHYLNPNDLLVFNNTQVIPARLFGVKPTGGKVEILIERMTANNRCLAHVRANKSLKPGGEVILAGGMKLLMLERCDDLFELEYRGPGDFISAIEQIGHMPLPPYIDREDEALDQERYQTVYASEKGAVAAPTAGLHFDEKLLGAIQQAGIDTAFVTLHVGAGTFQPVRVDSIEAHQMHAEYIEVTQDVCDKIKQCKARGGQVIAVGTTSLRSLESAAASGELQTFFGDTDIFIYPGYQFHVVDRLITNFHLPKSTLLMLVSAFSGMKMIRDAYQEAIDQQYRFFSYGDAMLLGRVK